MSRPTTTDYSKLLLDTPEALYWIGFILADGCIHHKKNCIDITISEEDKQHLENIFNIVNGTKINTYDQQNNWKKCCRICLCNKKLYFDFIEKYGMLSNKTINPPDIKSWNLSDDLLFSLIVGFFDGDGHVDGTRTYTAGRIKCHGSWFNNLNYFHKFWYQHSNVDTRGKVKFNGKGYSVFDLTSKSMFVALQKARELKLPLMKRKWDKIKEPQKRMNDIFVKEIRASKLSLKELSSIYGFSETTICLIKTNKTWKHVT